MSFYEFDANTLNDSKSFTQSIVRNIVPRNGKAVIGTSMSERGFTGRTLNSPDLISAASGKYLFKNQVYDNVFRSNIIRENLNSLSASIIEGQLPTVEGQDAGSLAAKILAQSGIGVEGNSGLLRNMSTALNSTYSNQSTGMFGVGENYVPHSLQDYTTSTGAIGGKYFDVATQSRLTEDQKSYYSARGELLSRSIYIGGGDKNVLINGFNFDIRDSNSSAEYDVVNSRLLGTADSIERRINEGLIKAPSQKAFVSANLIECLLALSSNSYGSALRIDGYNGGFGTFRQDGTTGSVPRSSGTQGNSITDHAFGRAFDIMSISSVATDQAQRHQGAKNITKITTKQGYRFQLDLLLKKLNAMPPHLVPDYMAISASFTDPEYDTMNDDESNLKTSIIGTKYTNLKHIKIKRDTSTAHDNHIHISFAATRGGVYTGPNGQLAIFGNPTSDPRYTSPDQARSENEKQQRLVGYSELTKDYTGNNSSVSPEIIYKSLVEYGLFTPELAACFVAIAERESKRILYIVQEKFGALGLWQVSTVPKDGGMATAYISQPEKEQIIYWKLALPDRANENLSEEQITSLIYERCQKR